MRTKRLSWRHCRVFQHLQDVPRSWEKKWKRPQKQLQHVHAQPQISPQRHQTPWTRKMETLKTNFDGGSLGVLNVLMWKKEIPFLYQKLASREMSQQILWIRKNSLESLSLHGTRLVSSEKHSSSPMGRGVCECHVGVNVLRAADVEGPPWCWRSSFRLKTEDRTQLRMDLEVESASEPDTQKTLLSLALDFLNSSLLHTTGWTCCKFKSRNCTDKSVQFHSRKHKMVQRTWVLFQQWFLFSNQCN